jgi:hypothetical protein
MDGRCAAGGTAGMVLGGVERAGEERAEPTGDVVAIMSGIRAVLSGGELLAGALHRLLSFGEGVPSSESVGEMTGGKT